MHIRSFANEIIDVVNVDLEIRVERTNRKRTISLQVKNNKLIIKTPRSVSKKTLVDLIRRKQQWIKKRAILNFEEQNLKNMIEIAVFLYRSPYLYHPRLCRLNTSYQIWARKQAYARFLATIFFFY